MVFPDMITSSIALFSLPDKVILTISLPGVMIMDGFDGLSLLYFRCIRYTAINEEMKDPIRMPRYAEIQSILYPRNRTDIREPVEI